MPLVADPLGGSHYVEWMTDEMERQAELVFSHLDDLGKGSILEGVYAAIDNGWFQREIADASYQLERKINNDRRIVVGVNAFTDAGDDDPLTILSIGHEVEERQLKRLDDVKHRRDAGALDAALARVAADAASPTSTSCPRSSTPCAGMPRSASSSTHWSACSAAGPRTRCSDAGNDVLSQVRWRVPRRRGRMRRLPRAAGPPASTIPAPGIVERFRESGAPAPRSQTRPRSADVPEASDVADVPEVAEVRTRPTPTSSSSPKPLPSRSRTPPPRGVDEIVYDLSDWAQDQRVHWAGC